MPILYYWKSVNKTKVRQLLRIVYLCRPHTYLGYATDLQKVPVISSLFRNERVNLYIEGNRNIFLVTKDGEIETMEQIIGEEITFSEALEEGAIRWEGVGFLNSLKFGVFGFLFSI